MSEEYRWSFSVRLLIEKSNMGQFYPTTVFYVCSLFAGCLEDVWIWRLSKGCLGDSKECLENVWSIEMPDLPIDDIYCLWYCHNSYILRVWGVLSLSGQCLAVSGECLGVSGGCLWNVKSNPR